eukprot:1607525-Amphidinium_carterae.3
MKTFMEQAPSMKSKLPRLQAHTETLQRLSLDESCLSSLEVACLELPDMQMSMMDGACSELMRLVEEKIVATANHLVSKGGANINALTKLLTSATSVFPQSTQVADALHAAGEALRTSGMNQLVGDIKELAKGVQVANDEGDGEALLDAVSGLVQLLNTTNLPNEQLQQVQAACKNAVDVMINGFVRRFTQGPENYVAMQSLLNAVSVTLCKVQQNNLQEWIGVMADTTQLRQNHMECQAWQDKVGQDVLTEEGLRLCSNLKRYHIKVSLDSSKVAETSRTRGMECAVQSLLDQSKTTLDGMASSLQKSSVCHLRDATGSLAMQAGGTTDGSSWLDTFPKGGSWQEMMDLASNTILSHDKNQLVAAMGVAAEVEGSTFSPLETLDKYV